MSSNPNNPRPISTIQPLIKSTYSLKLKTPLTFPSDSPVTKQSYKDECDINTIMARYQSTGEMPILNQRAPQYLDVSQIDFQEAQQFIAGAQTLFNELPSALRNRFDNDPGLFLDFCSNENNRPEMAELGLLRPETERLIPIPTSTPQTSPAATTSPQVTPTT